MTITKNRLREDAVNFVFGAHLGFPAEWQRRHAGIFVNLEQLGESGAAVSSEYMQLLRHSAVVDYVTSNVATYSGDPTEVPIEPFLNAPYLDDGTALPIEQRPIDLLFFGSTRSLRVSTDLQSLYGDAFYSNQVAGSYRSARAFLSHLFAYWKPTSMVDFGAGGGGVVAH